MPWVWTCIALCAPPAALFLLTNGSRRSDIDDVRRLSTCRSHDGKTAGSGQHREFSVYFRSVGAAAILLVVSVLNFTSVRAFMAVDFMTVRQPQEFHAARCVRFFSRSTRSPPLSQKLASWSLRALHRDSEPARSTRQCKKVNQAYQFIYICSIQPCLDYYHPCGRALAVVSQQN